MQYEVVEMKEREAIGLKARTNNMDPEMPMIIGGMWKRFYEDGIYANIPSKVNGKAMGMYTNYENNEKGMYDALVACEVEKGSAVPEGCEKVIIPAGKYAKFVVKGDMTKAVQEFWMQLWQENLDRNFICDYEEYQDCEMENATIHIYIGIR